MKTKVLLMLLDRIQKIENRIKKLEQTQTYYPITEGRSLSSIGGVDDIKITPAVDYAVDYGVDYKEGEE